MDRLIVLGIFLAALFYLYFKLVKKKGCSGCPSSKKECGKRQSCQPKGLEKSSLQKSTSPAGKSLHYQKIKELKN
ncbi:FeoB-associated Cys-rich membrane protein [Ignatzschineria cameli]|uniref:FeoB-associated Cys-rich membrane protein n=1 Tax=Ignatzschineria cameli TaxID=2182793 RepID=A0A2U2AQV0_9GAMM|nr:FeoB-associated Cys-rich membrane protein [Ignatzschineria cameli]PWD85326.1 hypothetical protein DC080_06620 [Ignatzschineria cameli]PWD86243.1 hypothetical protein DC077_05745 [Ignatzschineria cameli]PWD89920.1 hypothetical protein DC079_06185 [Ignatzschineria cameli]PWD91570.1 hypothetical protein DC081_05895 [Ignatzschineria cameli]PWD92607.1 hypothetical protein DC078_06180 [Ignatzschineria cameli]